MVDVFTAIAFNSKSASFGENTRIEYAAKLNFLGNTHMHSKWNVYYRSKPIRKKKNYYLAYQAHFFIAVVTDHRHQCAHSYSYNREHCNRNRMYLCEREREEKTRWKNIFSFVYFHQIKWKSERKLKRIRILSLSLLSVYYCIVEKKMKYSNYNMRFRIMHIPSLTASTLQKQYSWQRRDNKWQNTLAQTA